MVHKFDGTKHGKPQDPGPYETQREDPRTDRRHRNVNTNRHHQHQLPTKMLQRPLELAVNARGTHGENRHPSARLARHFLYDNE